MSTFEEQFPSLKNKRMPEYDIKGNYIPRENVVCVSKIMKFCLDKSFVRDVLEKEQTLKGVRNALLPRM